MSFVIDKWAPSRFSIKRKLCFLAGRLLSFRKACQWYDVLDRVNQFRNEKTKMVGIPSGRKHYFGEIYPRKDITEMVNMPFEGLNLPVPKGSDTYLKLLYGDYSIIQSGEKWEDHYIHAIQLENE